MDGGNTGFANLKNSLIELSTTFKVTRKQSKRIRKSQGPSREDALKHVQTDLDAVVESPLNTTPRPTYHFDTKAVGSFRGLYRRLKELRNMSDPARKDVRATEDALRDLVRRLDPSHPFIQTRGKIGRILLDRLD